jgi:hypothetical protein
MAREINLAQVEFTLSENLRRNRTCDGIGHWQRGLLIKVHSAPKSSLALARTYRRLSLSLLMRSSVYVNARAFAIYMREREGITFIKSGVEIDVRAENRTNFMF